MLRSIERTQVGNSVAQISGQVKEIEALDNIERELVEMQTRLIGRGDFDDDDAGKTMMVMARQLSAARSGDQVREVRHLLDLLTRKKSLGNRFV